MEKIYDVIIIGAGASGCFCASQIDADKSVLIIDANEKRLRKVFVSGGGRCNFTNINASSEYYDSKNSKFCISALKQFTPRDFINLVELNGIEYYEKHKGQLFCKESSLDIIKMLERSLSKNVSFQMKTRVLYALKKADLFQVKTNRGLFKAKSLIIASGGKSFPKLGASDIGYKIAESFDIEVEKPAPALVGLKSEGFKNLAGISLPVEIRLKASKNSGIKKINDDLLFTHKGISGPATLKASLFAKDKITINFCPTHDIFEYLKSKRKSKAKIENILSEILPKKFVAFTVENLETHFDMANISDKTFRKIGDKANNYIFDITDTMGYDTAEITKGGISTKCISSQTMEARNIEDLYFIGEVLDVSGYLGGYNLQWAWSSAFACAKDINSK